MQIIRSGRKQLLIGIVVLLSGLLAEFLILEGTIGISLPPDRHSALSSLEIKSNGMGLHFITQNHRFTVVDFWTAPGSRLETLVLRESVFMDKEDGAEGPPGSTVAVEAMNGHNAGWTLHEPGQQGDVLTNNLYRVLKLGCCGAPNTYIYFSLADGRKVVTSHSELSRAELVSLDGSVAK